MFKWLAGSYPDLFAKLDVSATQVYALDCTYSSRLPDERTALQVIQALDQRQQRPHQESRDNYQTSAYWGAKESRLKRLKAYLKHTEFQAQLDELKRAGRADLSAARSARVMSDPRLQEWCATCSAWKPR
ncbi:phage/plasmid replication protein, II/X family [Pseudomonas aeruginosa]|uniref:phage/plasmid replication protein, II/X family n=1 Tax=Pseudomonas aeruginosa TaxID=287 RepID=UPI0022369E94|nr:phage/plasmid replication protein, II/X family [Pseudomonas aeruginosa]